MARLSNQAHKVKEVLLARDKYANTKEWFDKLLLILSKDTRLGEDTLGLLEQELRGGYGWEYTKIRGEYEEHIRFWRKLAEHFPEQPKIQGILADTLLLAHRKDEALDLFIATFQHEPTLAYKFGGELYDFMKEKGGEHWLQYQLALIRAALTTDNDEYAREMYRKLLEEYRNDEAAMKKIRALAIGRLS